MRGSHFRTVILGLALLALPVIGYAQDAVVSGTVTDATGGVLPGVTVQAVHEASGNTFETVTDERGGYRIPVRTGAHRLTATLQDFSTVTRSLELQVGQQAVVNLQMSPSTVQETVTVTGEAPLVDTTTSVLGGNVDTRQMQELPINGRNWLALTMLAPGSRTNAVTDSPLPGGTGGDSFQVNVDGQQVTLNIAGSVWGQPRFSRDAIAEFEYVSNRFDASQGRSTGVQVNVVSKSGTNTPSGSLSGYFRDDSLNAADFIAGRVLSYSNQQISATYGGPIRLDRVHVFGHYEYEREPNTFHYTSPFPRFNVTRSGTREEHKGGARLDFEFTSAARLMVRGSKLRHLQPLSPRTPAGATVHPSGTARFDQSSEQLYGLLTQVLGNRAVNEVKVGYTYFYFADLVPAMPNPNSPSGTGQGTPQLNFRGYTIGTPPGDPLTEFQQLAQFRDDFTYSYNMGGRHTLKIGGEYVRTFTRLTAYNGANGIFDMTGGPIPANIEDLFPVWNDVSTWNLNALSPIAVRMQTNIGVYTVYSPKRLYAGWAQDDWAITPRLTLNLGVRYDLEKGMLAEELAMPPFLPANRPADTNNIAPRLGAAFSLDDRTVIRGGYGQYFDALVSQAANSVRFYQNLARVAVVNDGRPDFMTNPFNGPRPTIEQVRQSGTAQAEILNSPPSLDFQMPYSYQTSIGVQRQLGDTMAAQADYVWTGNRHVSGIHNINLAYDPATGINYPFRDVSKRPFPDWGFVLMQFSENRANYHGLQTAFMKRFSQRWQATGTYTLSGFWDALAQPVSGSVSYRPVPFEVAPDLGGEYTLAAADQRHRAVFNGIWEPGYGFQLSGLYFFGSGQRYDTRYGGDFRLTGGGGNQQNSARRRPDGTIVPRNNFVGKPIHRVDLRVQRQFRLGGRARMDGMVEVFNLFNHANYGSYVTVESNARYGRPTQNTNVAYQPRILQLGFRFAF